MRRLILLAVIAASVPIATAQAAATGTITGTVEHADTGRPKPGIEVTLTTGTQDGELETSTAVTDSRGRYRFEDLATGKDHFYALDAAYDGGLFAGRPLVIPSDTTKAPVIRSTLRVWDTTTDPAAILIRRNDVFVVQDENGVGVIESVRIVNPSDLAYIGRGADTNGDASAAGATPSIGFWLPQSADKRSVQIIEGDIDVPTLLPTEYGFAATVAIPPGETRLTFTYRVEGPAGTYDLTRTALYSTGMVEFYAEPPLSIKSNRLTDKGPVKIGDVTYTRYATEEGLDPADPVQVLATADAGMPLGLLAGVGGAAVLILGAGILGWRRSRGSQPAERSPIAREILVARIAELDLRRQAGEISEEEYSTRRTAMKNDLSAREPQRAP
jgi:hypothetical protein